MKTIRTAFYLTLVVGLFSALVACQTEQPNVTNSFGTISGFVDADPSDVADATTKALQEKGYSEIKKTETDNAVRMVARNQDDTKIDITITKHGNNVSKLEIHYGAFGNETKSIELYDTIQKSM
ncbi:hypothetical protein KS4_29620 [Poriferisphaera corsica]|uniref:DUF3568 family protein n=1 Tax=Poriferisphaera corsica TaxID=2528020 RepID=A0A517YXD3_9BACT|nr:DUF3568 family protein [Poriferisphaera corsica]QDU34886.1 hypothetical protein KS4_29620 [Poriferisphaera corsica]